MLARAHLNGIAFSFQAEPERRRFVRLERAAEFGARYGHGAREFAAYRAFHQFASGRWPGGGRFDVTGDESDMYVAWVRLLEALVECARLGPTEPSLARVTGIVARAVRQDEPQWALPWLSYAALAQAWAARHDEMQASIEAMLSVADRTSDPDLSLTLLCGGFPSAAIVLLLGRHTARLAAMEQRLEGLDAHAGERELLRSFQLWLDGDPVEVPLGAATVALRQRGLDMAVAFALPAMRAVRPEATLPRDIHSTAQEILRGAQAVWLADLGSA